LSELVDCFGKPAAIRLDNAPELTADAFTTWAKEQGIELPSFSQVSLTKMLSSSGLTKAF
jgi:hypothetical protein